MTEFGTCHWAFTSVLAVERTVALTSTSAFGMVKLANPLIVDCHGSTLLQPRGSGPADPVLVATVGAYSVDVSHVFTTPRPVLELL